MSEIDTEEEPVDEPTDKPTQAPNEGPTQEPTEDGHVELDLGFLDSMADYTSYRSRMIITVEGTQDGKAIKQSIEMIMEVTTDPPAQHMSMSGDMLGDQAGVEGIEMYLVEDAVYLQMGGKWMSVPAGAETPIDEDMFSPESFIRESCGWERQPDTEVLGVPVHHWAADRAGVEDCATEKMLENMGEIRAFNADVYGAIDGGYMVQMDIYYEGDRIGLGLMGVGDKPLEEANLAIHFQYTDVNAPFTIRVPEEAWAGDSLPDDIPKPPEAGNVTGALGLTMIETRLSGQQVYDYYLAQMPANGWTQDSAEQSGDTYRLEFSKDRRSASFMISGDEETSVTSVLITISEE